jgi:hypothetical protein
VQPGVVRRSTVVQLTLLPMLASAAVAAADPPGADAPIEGAPPADPSLQPPGMAPVIDAAAPPADPPLQPPGMAPMADPAAPPMSIDLAPPGMTPTITELDCDDDPSWRLRPDCDLYDDGAPGGVIRGGFGSYFWSGGG